MGSLVTVFVVEASAQPDGADGVVAFPEAQEVVVAGVVAGATHRLYQSLASLAMSSSSFVIKATVSCSQSHIVSVRSP
jgi:hypothetical protein